MSDETADLSNTLTWTCGMVLQSGPEDRQRIALAYQEAQQLVATIPTDNGDARPRIVACFERSDGLQSGRRYRLRRLDTDGHSGTGERTEPPRLAKAAQGHQQHREATALV